MENLGYSESEKEKREESLEKRKEKMRKWLENPYNLLLLGVLIFSLAIFIYYFNLTKAQTLWWDEAEYMSTAKHWAFGVPYDINPQRPPIFPFLASLLYRIGITDLIIKFLLSVLPAWLSVLFIYLLILEIYNDKKIALITAFIFSVSWINLFYSMRFMTDSIGFFAGIMAFYFFWKGYINQKGYIYTWLVGFFIAISFLSRLTGILYGGLIFVFLLFSDKFRFLKSKHIWMIPLVFILTISPYLLWSYSYYGNAFAFRAGYESMPTKTFFGTWIFPHVYYYPEFIFFIFFLLGFLTLIPMLLSIDLLIFKKDRKYIGDLFILVSLVFTLLFFGFFLSEGGENRWLIMMSIGIFALSAKGILLISDLARENIGKILAIGIMLLILTAGSYYQLKHVDFIIKDRAPSYSDVKAIGLWLKENSLETDSVMTISHPQIVYYSERKVYEYANKNVSEVKKIIQEHKPAFFTFSQRYEAHMLKPDILPWIQENSGSQNSLLIPVYATFADQARTQAIFVIFKINYASTISSAKNIIPETNNSTSQTFNITTNNSATQSSNISQTNNSNSTNQG